MQFGTEGPTWTCLDVGERATIDMNSNGMNVSLIDIDHGKSPQTVLCHEQLVESRRIKPYYTMNMTTCGK